MGRRHDAASARRSAPRSACDRAASRRGPAPSRSSAPRRCWASQTCAMVGNSNSPSTTVAARSCRTASAVAIAAMAVEALGITAISSASAPIDAAKAARSRSTSPTQRSHGEPSVCHDSMNASSAASTSSRQRALRAAVHVHGVAEDRKPGAELVERSRRHGMLPQPRDRAGAGAATGRCTLAAAMAAPAQPSCRRQRTGAGPPALGGAADDDGARRRHRHRAVPGQRSVGERRRAGHPSCPT